MLNDFRDEDLVLDVEGLNVDDGCYTWYMSVKTTMTRIIYH
mgnify:CR=1 FL=1